MRELIHLDAYYRRRRGDTPAAGEYLRAFPDLDPGWLDTATADGGAADPDATRTAFPADPTPVPGGRRGASRGTSCSARSPSGRRSLP